MRLNTYPDGTTYIESHEPDDESMGAIEYTFRINNYGDLWTLNQWVDAYNTNHYGIPPSIFIPNLIDAQADRRFAPNQSSGLKLVCQFLNGLNAHFRIFHPHNPEVIEALMDNVEITDNLEFVSKVLLELKDRDKETYPDRVEDKYVGPSGNFRDSILDENLILMSSDAGGFKPLMKLCEQLQWEGETFSASKARTYVDGKSKLTQVIDRDDFQGKDILIIDDICVYGGTFKGLAKLLREKNCGKLYLAVSHMTVQDLGEDPITHYFDGVYTTNSKFPMYTVPDKADSEHLGKLHQLEIFKY